MEDSTSTHNPEPSEIKREPKYDALVIQLTSQRPSDIWLGVEQARQWLKKDPENQEIYGLLLDAVKANHEQLLRDNVRNLLTELMEKKKSKSAEKALSNLPGGVQDLLADADDEYYAAEYEKAIQLYRRVLRLEPENPRAKDHLAKSEIKLITGESTSGVPRSAEQFYRRARSYLAARDIVAARNLFNAAVEAAQAKGVIYPAAEQALNDMENLIKAEELRRDANQLFEQGAFREAFSRYDGAINLDPKNEQVKKELGSLQNLWFAENELRGSKILKIFSPLTKWQDAVNKARLFIGPNNTQLKFVEKQIQGIQRTRLIFVFLIILGALAGLFSTGMFSGIQSFFTSKATSTPTLSFPTNTLVVPVSPTETIEPIITITATSTEMPTVIPTETLAFTPTQASLGTGYIVKAFVSSWDAPNGKFIENLGLYQTVIVLEKQDVAGSTWYKCSWNNQDGLQREGWILGEYIIFGTPPTPRP